MSSDAAGSALPLDQVLSGWSVLVVRWELANDDLLGPVKEGPIGDVATYNVPAAEARMRLLLKLDDLLTQFFDDEQLLREWLRRPNVHLNRRTPLQVMEQSPEWVRWMISALGVIR